jgi:hypothetical protein
MKSVPSLSPLRGKAKEQPIKRQPSLINSERSPASFPAEPQGYFSVDGADWQCGAKREAAASGGLGPSPGLPLQVGRFVSLAMVAPLVPQMKRFLCRLSSSEREAFHAEAENATARRLAVHMRSIVLFAFLPQDCPGRKGYADNEEYGPNDEGRTTYGWIEISGYGFVT